MECSKRSRGVGTRVLAGLVLAGVGLAGGCSSYEAPNLKVVDARVTQRSAEAVVVTFTIDAENPNSEAIPLRDVEYRVSLDGRQVFKGTRSAEATLRRYGTQQIRLPAAIALSEPGAGASAANYRIEGTLQYTTPGELAEILFDAGVRNPSVGFSGEGKADLTAEAPAPPVAPMEPPHEVAPPQDEPARDQPAKEEPAAAAPPASTPPAAPEPKKEDAPRK